LSQGGRISFDNIPPSGILAAQDAARKCRLNDVGLDLIRHDDQWLIIEANMKYGRKGLKMKGLDLKEILRAKLVAEELG
jgi:ribosomal protein S6--L-glutamate ligase